MLFVAFLVTNALQFFKFENKKIRVKRMKDETDLKPQIVPGAIDELMRHFGKVQNN
jgi:hypothetical protein